jgi:hypothetical protein
VGLRCNAFHTCSATGNDVCSPNGDVCDLVTDVCCAPETNTAACKGVGCGQVGNNCHQPVDCPNTCASNALCVGNTCCVPESPAAVAAVCQQSDILCGPTTDNCGQTVQCPFRCGPAEMCQGNSRVHSVPALPLAGDLSLGTIPLGLGTVAGGFGAIRRRVTRK